jgi:hypothetical protein
LQRIERPIREAKFAVIVVLDHHGTSSLRKLDQARATLG